MNNFIVTQNVDVDVETDVETDVESSNTDTNIENDNDDFDMSDTVKLIKMFLM